MCRSRINIQPITYQHSSYYHTNTNSEPERPWRMKPAHKSLLIWHVLVIAYYLSSSFCECMQDQDGFQLVDLSHTFDNKTIYWVTEPMLVMDVVDNGTVPGQNYWYQKERISAATHGGTHLDAPCHFAEGRWCVSDIPLDHLVVPAMVIDISTRVDGNPNVHLTPAHLMEWEREHGQIPKGSLLLIYTGWSKFWPDPLQYTGTSDRKVEELRFPSISGEAAKWIIENRDIVGIGIDVMSIDVPTRNKTSIPITHVMLYERNIYGLENVNNLHLLPPRGANVYVMPMKLRSASGAPCRIVAQFPKSLTSGSISSMFCANLNYLIAAVLCIVFSLKF